MEGPEYPFDFTMVLRLFEKSVKARIYNSRWTSCLSNENIAPDSHSLNPLFGINEIFLLLRGIRRNSLEG